MAKTHIEFAQNYNKEPDDLKEVAGTINEASKYIISHRQNWKQIQKDLQVVAHLCQLYQHHHYLYMRDKYHVKNQQIKDYYLVECLYDLNQKQKLQEQNIKKQ
eukprot:137867_1